MKKVISTGQLPYNNEYALPPLIVHDHLHKNQLQHQIQIQNP